MKRLLPLLAAAALLVSAVAAFAQTDSLTPGSPALSPSCSEGLHLFQARQFSAAAPYLRRCLEESGDRVESLMALTIISLHDKRLDLAEDYGSRMLALAPDSPDALYWYGRALLADGDAAGARAQWERGLQIDAEHPGLLEALARLLLDYGEDAPAYGLLTQLKRVGSDQGWVHRALSDVARRRGLWSEALDHWRQALEADPPTADDMLVASELAILTGDTTYAVFAGRTAVRIDSSATSWSALGEAYFAAERLPEAREALQKAVDLDSTDPRSRFNLANVLEIVGASDEADRHFRRYVELAPDDIMGHFNFAVHLERAGRVSESLKAVDRAAALDSTFAPATLLKAKLLEAGGDPAGALREVDRLLGRGVDSGEDLPRWRESLAAQVESRLEGLAGGKYRLQHIVLQDREALDAVLAELAAGADFAALAQRFSMGQTAARGGDIGWVAPAEMAGPLRAVIEPLQPNEISPPAESGGLIHLFRRLP